MSLKHKIDEYNAQISTRIPPLILEHLNEGRAELMRKQVSRHALKIGSQAPDFTLPDIEGAPVRLANLLRKGPVVLTFYRGGWCPYCNLQLRAYQSIVSEIEAYGATLVAVSPQLPERSAKTSADMKLDFQVLTDVGSKVASLYGLVFRVPDSTERAHRELGVMLPHWNGDDSWTLPTPATYVIDRTGEIRFSFIEDDYVLRAEPANILESLRKLPTA